MLMRKLLLLLLPRTSTATKQDLLEYVYFHYKLHYLVFQQSPVLEQYDPAEREEKLKKLASSIKSDASEVASGDISLDEVHSIYYILIIH